LEGAIRMRAAPSGVIYDYHLPPKEKLASRWFGLAYAIGIATVAVQFSLFSLPATCYALRQAIGQVADSDVGGPVFWDGAILLSLAAFRLALYGKGAQTALRDRRNKRAVRQVQ